ncbi:hypothetical protein TNCV_550801 [Trichonephila clavipes]|nr:hypothetical protein TNCV_550801 [Trichonephila clavipes]
MHTVYPQESCLGLFDLRSFVLLAKGTVFKYVLHWLFCLDKLDMLFAVEAHGFPCTDVKHVLFLGIDSTLSPLQQPPLRFFAHSGLPMPWSPVGHAVGTFSCPLSSK